MGLLQAYRNQKIWKIFKKNSKPLCCQFHVESHLIVTFLLLNIHIYNALFVLLVVKTRHRMKKIVSQCTQLSLRACVDEKQVTVNSMSSKCFPTEVFINLPSSVILRESWRKRCVIDISFIVKHATDQDISLPLDELVVSFSILCFWECHARAL